MTTMLNLLNLEEVKGDLGVEIEVEGVNLPRQMLGWHITRDGSLKSNESLEYVFDKPMSLGATKAKLKAFEESFAASDFYQTGRAGVHVHVNVQELTPTQLINMIVTYLILEEPLLELCGESRKGNHFCLRSKDAGGTVKVLKDCLKKNSMHFLNSDMIRYSALNLCSLFRYGSLEFRCMESTKDSERLGRWCSILLALREFARNFDDPTDVINRYFQLSPEEFWKAATQTQPPLKTALLRECLGRGVDIAEDVAYIRDWTDAGGVIDIFAKKEEGWF